ncbi:VOC family protein [Bacteroides sp.]
MNNKQAEYIHISFPYREELCSYTFAFEDVEDEKQLPLVSLGYWQGTIELQTHKLLEWQPDFGECYFQAKVCDEGTYTLLDAGKKPICTLKGYVPNGVIPPDDGAGDYIHFGINMDGTVEGWRNTYDFTEFNEGAIPTTEDSATVLSHSRQRPVMKFNTIGLFTDRQSQMVAFYRNIWEFKTTWDGHEPNVEMTYDHIRLIMFPRKEFEQMVSQRFDYPKGLNGTMELSFDLPTFDDVDSEYNRCLQQGVKGVMPPTTEPWGQRIAYIADPDGNLIELSSFTVSTKEPEKKAYTLEEKRQEHGNAYLPWEKEADEYLIRLYDEGKSIKELAEIFERNNGGIRSRLKKLGKIE